MEALVRSSLADSVFKEGEERTLAGVRLERGDLPVEIRANCDDGGRGSRRNRRPLRHGERRGGIVKLLRAMWLKTLLLDLVSELIRPSRPMKSHGSEK